LYVQVVSIFAVTKGIVALDVFIHETAICESVNIGSGTRIWPFAHILKGAIIGKNCNICESVFIEDEVNIGDNVTIKNGVQVWNGISIGQDVFIGPNVTFTNDKYPKSGNREFALLPTMVGNGASIGANSTILCGITIGENSIIGAGSVVTKSVAAGSTVYGNPARIKRRKILQVRPRVRAILRKDN
jgi:acetyltransferase-like isoleucine patch superfamily enzyme